MKFLKLYEDYDIELDKLKKGDYVIVECDDNGLHNTPVVLIRDPEKNPDGFTISVRKLNSRSVAYFTIYDHEIVRKLEPWEVDAIKYNI